MILIILSSLIGFGSAYDFFEGSLPLLHPCFPTHDHASCTLERVQCPSPLPESSGGNPPNTKLYLFTVASRGKAEAVHKCPDGLPPNSTFNLKHPLVVVVHGYLDGICRSAWMRELKLQFFIRGPFNVILVDWTWGNGIDIIDAAINTRIVGQQLACFIENLYDKFEYDPRRVHLVGHSYGAAVVATTGKLLQGKLKVGRITGLDPGMAPFDYETMPKVIKPSYAHFVDVIHTNSGHCIFFFFSDPRQLGHVDFYVNGGSYQPSCFLYTLASFLKLDFFYALVSFYPAACSHLQSIQYFKVSINAVEQELVGVECDSEEDFKSGKCARRCEGGYPHCAVMGMDAELYYNKSDTKQRSYYVPTTLRCPYYDYSGFTGLPLTPLNVEK